MPKGDRIMNQSYADMQNSKASSDLGFMAVKSSILTANAGTPEHKEFAKSRAPKYEPPMKFLRSKISTS